MIKPSHQRKRPMKRRQVKYNANQVHVPALRRAAFELFCQCSESHIQKQKQHVRSYCFSCCCFCFSGCVLCVVVSGGGAAAASAVTHACVYRERKKVEKARTTTTTTRTANIYVYCSTRESADRGQSKILDPVSNRWSEMFNAIMH